MNASPFVFRHLCNVDVKVSHLAVEVILICVPLRTVASWDIWIRVNDRQAFEIWQCDNGWDVERVSDELGIVELDDGSGDTISTRREVDDGRKEGGAVTLKCAARTIGNGVIDSDSIVRDSVTWNRLEQGHPMVDADLPTAP